MKNQQLINDIIKRMVQVYDPLEVYLFDNEFWEENEAPDDIDLNVIVQSSTINDCDLDGIPDQAPIKRAVTGQEALHGLAENIHVLVFTKAELDAMERTQRLTFRYIQKYGTKIYSK